MERTWRLVKADRTQGLRSQTEENRREMSSTFFSVDFGSLLILGKQKWEFGAPQEGGGPGKLFNFQSRTLKGYVPENEQPSPNPEVEPQTISNPDRSKLSYPRMFCVPKKHTSFLEELSITQNHPPFFTHNIQESVKNYKCQEAGSNN